jgi:hypothetical protein
MRQIPYAEPTNGHLHTKFSLLGHQAPRIWAPLYDCNICMCDSEQVSKVFFFNTVILAVPLAVSAGKSKNPQTLM